MKKRDFPWKDCEKSDFFRTLGENPRERDLKKRRDGNIMYTVQMEFHYYARRAAVAENSKYILDLLKNRGVVSEEQIDEGWKQVEESKGELDILEALKQNGVIQEEQLTAILAEEFGLETMNLETYAIPPEVAALVPPDVARQYHVVPVEVRDGVLVIAMSDPMDMDTLDSLRYLLGRDVEAVIAPESQISRLLDSDFGGLEDKSERL